MSASVQTPGKRAPANLALTPALAGLVTLIAIDAVVDIARNVVVVEVVRVVAAMASRALEHRVVIRIRMAGRAHTVGVAVAGRERRVLGVIERSTRPCGCVVASLAGGREELRLRLVSGVGRVVVVGLVAANARGRQRRVIVVNVAIGADPRRNGVRASKGEGRVVVIERGIRPAGRVVAEFARGREARRRMGRIGSARVVLLVARVAERAVQRVIVVDVAVGAEARRHRVRTGQRKAG